ncbi:MAG: Xaa-Pro aminopeptidase [Pseudohongiellaceae bacterium]|jgi:Xaa-Pro aminopeptidase
MRRRLTKLRAVAVLVALCLQGCQSMSTLPNEAAVPAPLRDRAALTDRWLADRLETLLPQLMRQQGIDMWLLVAREYNEDPVLATMLPATWLGSTRRRTMLMFFDRGAVAGVEGLAVARYAVGDLIEGAWDPATQPDQWARLAELVAERNPSRIAVNVSPTFALADGLSASEHQALLAALGEHAARVVPGEGLAVGWLETRSDPELAEYPAIVALAHAILAEGLSSAAVEPGVTTTDDLCWWFRERVVQLQLETWFHPSVSVQRDSAPAAEGSFAEDDDDAVIRPGDLVHVDFGIRYLGLNTDTQQHAYVLRPGEQAAPPGLVSALAAGNRLQDLFMAQFVAGRTGNEILAAALGAAAVEGLDATIYTHPLGLHGHAAGPTIGLWDQQGGVAGTGDYPLFANTAYAIELALAVDVPEWGQPVRIMLEEDALFDGETVRFLDGRQTELHLIR